MTVTMLLGLVFIVILGLEWRYRFRVIRMSAAVLALLVLFFAQSNPYRAMRGAIVMRPAERITHLPGGPPLSEYQIGVVTMERAVNDDVEIGRNARLLATGVLLWLACSPAFKRDRTPPVAESLTQQLMN